MVILQNNNQLLQDVVEQQASVKKTKTKPKSLNEKSTRELHKMEKRLDEKIVKEEDNLKSLQRELERKSKEIKDLKKQHAEMLLLLAKKAEQEAKK
ncbi:hypothetical protein [Helicobacter heilmannii]|uniref:hypothetical protein n=1 Tax=Helicobacter heilmannii TaxID=35817 RepID=UPI0006A0536E|nr:hypothetical protein [Helicobacter heilmannii]CRF49185.1 hypothetical protein HHE03_07840 [Helicobacter heilmannii]CRF50888.1 hypothetical protein HHE06_07420 [Helicobacter heilmannii]BDQ26835.1 hypothetical protein ASB1_05110 [Helicobacter heilmannii]BDQ27399.1 hypothetical protein ASB1_10750 [Helicobacter heilmannii]GMB95384.1 hypothetical protein NHP21011_14900 [Helicobacter heilmannii]